MAQGSRAVLLVAGAGLVVAWLAAAADRRPAAPAMAAARDATALARAEHLADDIQAQATRLRAHLAAAPEPAPAGRNPFTFRERAVSTPRHDRIQAAAALEATLGASAPEAPPLTLSGIAEEEAGAEKAAPPVRTAVLSGYGEVFLVKVGETVASRYQVTAIDADAVEMKDLFTGRTIHLGLR